MSDFRRVVVTGVGAVTPVGNDVESLWQGLMDGRAGAGPITHFDASAFPVRIACEVRDFDPTRYLDHRSARRSGRFSQLAVAAATQALCAGGLVVTEANRDDIGAVISSSGAAFSMGNQEQVIAERGPNRIDPLLIPKLGAHMAAARVGRVFGIRGPNSTINSACASGTDALGHAFNLIRTGQTEALLAGGAEAVITPVAVAAMAIVGALTSGWNEEPPRASRPFDAKRSGFVLGEGAGILLLESEEFARRRGATILAEFAGAGWSFDATDDTAPDVDGQALAMARALQCAGIGPEDVDYINAHGTSTELNDKTETAAIKKALGEQRARSIPVSSTKSMTGHLAAAAGGVEAVISVLTLAKGVIPPTINYEYPDPECDLDYVPNTPRAARLDCVLSNSFGLGGQNAANVFRRYG